MNHRQISRRFQPDSPADVLNEVLAILKLISLDFDTDPVKDVFNAAKRLYTGKYLGYRACNTDYHDHRHACAVFLAMARLIHGAVIDKVTFTVKQVVLGLTAAILHDAGYIKEASDKDGTGAKHTARHVQRSMEFLNRHGAEHGLTPEEIAAVQNMIRCTDLSTDIATVNFSDSKTELLGKMLGTADLLAQLADRIYLEKLLFLYYEYKEGGVGDYKSELDVLKNAVEFYDYSEDRLKTTLDGTDRFMSSHFASQWNIDKNLYREMITRQKNYLLKILKIPDADPRDHLKRGGIVEKIRNKYHKKGSAIEKDSN
ncbi:MAG: hypothetical protein JSU83_09855 [Deltaproteobacteria bacterium]|nr:MAG: hypothetical protein JSU83_09855 [Deltaproteobacteria bacterium]